MGRRVLAALSIVLATVAAGCAGSDRPVPRSPVSVSVNGGDVRIPAGFVGLSIEYPSIMGYAGTNPDRLDPVFVQLVRNLTPGQTPILRIGGDTTDSTWWPVRGMQRPPGVIYTLDGQWLAVARALVRALGARVILSLNLEANSPEVARVEAARLVAGLGRGSVRALEIGNEPSLYAHFPWYRTAQGTPVLGRPQDTYNYGTFLAQWRAVAAVLPALPLAGPSLGDSQWLNELAGFVSDPRVGLATVHTYPLRLCASEPPSPRFPSVANLLSSRSSGGLAASVAPYVRAVRERGLPVRIDEFNTVSCGADAAVSQTFASALWAIDVLFSFASVGVEGVNLHTFPGAGYDLFRVTRTPGGWRADVSPEYYGLLLFAQAAPAGARLLPVRSAGLPGQVAWATLGRDGKLRAVLIDKTTRPWNVALQLGRRWRSATVQRLLAPSLAAASGISLGARSFGSATASGYLRPAPRALSGAAGTFDLTVPGPGAALVVARGS